jgi:hypothetical protein
MKKRKRPQVVSPDGSPIEQSQANDRGGAHTAAEDKSQQKPPFTTECVRQVLREVLHRRQALPSDAEIERLAEMLNQARGFVALAREFPPDEHSVRDAIEVLADFFEKRRLQAMSHAKWYGGEKGASLVRAEVQLHDLYLALEQALRATEDAFRAFLEAMSHHDWSLDMDTTVLMPKHERWHDVSVAVAAAFRLAMASVRPGRLGSSSDGPVARFVAAVLPQIAHERVTPAAVAKHLHRVTPKNKGTNSRD